tara:strand:- start:684 stop:890 length:207 start_codon:yes stop_codon:yes gene_type:complete
MSDDLVTRLRRYPYDFTEEAADRIERLEAALRDVIDSWDWWQVDTYDRCASVPGDAIATARAALEGKD